jgi:hypothetical protein
VRLLGDLDRAEEAIHEAFAAALEFWSRTGIPDKPRTALQSAETALTVCWKNGKVAITDGPYAETKEQLGGILVLEAMDMNHAVQLIGQHPALTFGSIFEIRPAGDMSEIMKASEQRRRQNNRYY